jgi:glycosyltransferase involved in cell wall biosynthesis
MKLWNVCPTHDPAYGGLYRGINDFAEALKAPILSFDDGRKDRSTLSDGALRITTGRGPLSRDCHVVPRSASREAANAVENADLLVVHSLFRGHTRWAATWARQNRRPYWAVPHGCLNPWSLQQRSLLKRAWLAMGGQRYLNNAERVIFSTRRGLEEARKWGSPGQAVTLPWPVSVPQEPCQDRARAAFRLRVGIPADAPILLHVGRLHSVKRPIHAVQAFCQVADSKAHLVIVGMEGDVSVTTVLDAVPAEHRPRVHFAGTLIGPDLAEAYQAADGFLSLSHQENFGYAVGEALAYGLPVILSPGHDLAHEMPQRSDGQLTCGWLLPDDSRPAAVQAIEEWSQLARSGERGRLELMSRGGRSWAAEMLSPERFRENLFRLL